VRFVRLFLDPVDRLVRAGELADTAELPPVKVPETAVRTPLRPVQFRNGDTLTIELFALFEDLIRANFRTEVTPFAPVLVDGEFHGSTVLIVCIYSATVTKNLFFVLRVIRPEAGEDHQVFDPWAELPGAP
jgi:hypothetical protein